MDEELDRGLVDIWVTWDGADLEKTCDALEAEGIDDQRIDVFQDQCMDWVEKHMDDLIEDYKIFVREKVSELRNEKKVQ